MTFDQAKQKAIIQNKGLYSLNEDEIKLVQKKLIKTTNETIISAEYDFNKEELFVRSIRYDSQDRLYSMNVSHDLIDKTLFQNSKKVK